MNSRILQACLAALAQSMSVAAQAQPKPDQWTINGERPTPRRKAQLETLERAMGMRLPGGSYWYDRRSGAIGVWGGPTAGFIPAGLDLGPPMPAECSGGKTGVFINGRELHPIDVLRLRQITIVLPGRYWLDSSGVGGVEGGPPSFNLVALAQQAQQRARGSGGSGGSGGPWSRSLAGGGYVSGDGHSSVMVKDVTGHGVIVGP